MILKSLLDSLRPHQPADPAALPSPPPSRSPPPDRDFMDHLMKRFFANLGEYQQDNFDYERFNVAPGTPMGADTRPSFLWYQLMRKHIGQLEQARDLFIDQASRLLYEDLLLYRLLLHPYMRLSTNNERHWALREQARTYRTGPSTLGGFSFPLYRYRLEFAGESIDFQGADGSIAWSFLLKQYFFERDGVVIQVEPGDIVIDAGACLGDTALAFAAAAGPAGRVFAFDIMPAHLEAIRANLAANPALAERIEAVEAALSDSSAQTLYIHGSGPGAHVSDKPSEHRVAVQSIDEFAAQHKLPRVDFIKMDIEGAEGLALHGAVETIRRHRPKLAISLYHRPTDICDLPLLIDSLGVDYDYYLDHYTIHVEETVLYAVPRG